METLVFKTKSGVELFINLEKFTYRTPNKFEVIKSLKEDINDPVCGDQAKALLNIINAMNKQLN